MATIKIKSVKNKKYNFLKKVILVWFFINLFLFIMQKWLVFAQSVTITTNIENAIQTIKKVFVTSDWSAWWTTFIKLNDDWQWELWIQTWALVDKSVTSWDLADWAVTERSLATWSVTNDKLWSWALLRKLSWDYIYNEDLWTVSIWDSSPLASIISAWYKLFVKWNSFVEWNSMVFGTWEAISAMLVSPSWFLSSPSYLVYSKIDSVLKELNYYTRSWANQSNKLTSRLWVDWTIISDNIKILQDNWSATYPTEKLEVEWTNDTTDRANVVIRNHWWSSSLKMEYWNWLYQDWTLQVTWSALGIWPQWFPIWARFESSGFVSLWFSLGPDKNNPTVRAVWNLWAWTLSMWTEYDWFWAPNNLYFHNSLSDLTFMKHLTYWPLQLFWFGWAVTGSIDFFTDWYSTILPSVRIKNWNLWVWIDNWTPDEKLTVKWNTKIISSLDSSKFLLMWNYEFFWQSFWLVQSTDPSSSNDLVLNLWPWNIWMWKIPDPSYRLDVLWDIRASWTITPSDKRLKTNLKKLDNSLESVLKLNWYNYTSTVYNPDQKRIWVIAQEVEQLYPELIRKDDKWYLAVDYQWLIPVLIEAIKEQQKQIDTLKQIVKDIKK